MAWAVKPGIAVLWYFGYLVYYSKYNYSMTQRGFIKSVGFNDSSWIGLQTFKP